MLPADFDALLRTACWGALVPYLDPDSLCRMLRQVAPQFEHRLFLSATPRNGHSKRSFAVEAG